MRGQRAAAVKATPARARAAKALGFIGLGVMGGPMCANLARRSGRVVRCTDLDPTRRAVLAGSGAVAVDSPDAVADGAEIVFLSLPGPKQIESVVARIAPRLGRGAVIVDMSTIAVGLAQAMARKLARHGIAYVDAPVAGTKHTVAERRISVMVGGGAGAYRRVAPLLSCIAEDVLHCGKVGAGATVKVILNTVIAETGVALAEALTLGRRAGVDGKVLFGALAKGCDSFPLRHHGMKFMLPGRFPRDVFPTRYMMKDVGYCLELARDLGFAPAGMKLAHRLLKRTADSGMADAYWPALIRVLPDAAPKRPKGAAPAARRPRRKAA
ncbi:MAG: NAD(P)-dependent oxidoreductase [Alphaproteobacteria bacterium]|nr:NAD(P)-dependent oxidoreductase [Alphaproteobacteria bacterium]